MKRRYPGWNPGLLLTCQGKYERMIELPDLDMSKLDTSRADPPWIRSIKPGFLYKLDADIQDGWFLSFVSLSVATSDASGASDFLFSAPGPVRLFFRPF